MIPLPDSEDIAQYDLETRLIIEVFRNAPVSIWACDREFKVVLWSKGSMDIYGRSPDEMVGAQYFEKFVDPLEEEQSKEDCIRIIDHNTPHRNFIATDHCGSPGDAEATRLMLTNCFRIVDPVTKIPYQAEIGVDISDLEQRMATYHRLREEWTRQQAIAMLQLDTERSQTKFAVGRMKYDLGLKRERVSERIAAYRAAAPPHGKGREEVFRLAGELKASLEREWTALAARLDLLKARAMGADVTAEELQEIRAEVEDPSPWFASLEESLDHL